MSLLESRGALGARGALVDAREAFFGHISPFLERGVLGTRRVDLRPDTSLKPNETLRVPEELEAKITLVVPEESLRPDEPS